jgi:hypothetical protein
MANDTDAREEFSDDALTRLYGVYNGRERG